MWLLFLGGWFSFAPCCCSDAGLLSGGESRAAEPVARCYFLAIEGMTCKDCARHVQQALAMVPGVAEAHVNFAKAEAAVCSRRGSDVKAQALFDAVRKAGYRAKLKRQ